MHALITVNSNQPTRFNRSLKRERKEPCKLKKKSVGRPRLLRCFDAKISNVSLHTSMVFQLVFLATELILPVNEPGYGLFS